METIGSDSSNVAERVSVLESSAWSAHVRSVWSTSCSSTARNASSSFATLPDEPAEREETEEDVDVHD